MTIGQSTETTRPDPRLDPELGDTIADQFRQKKGETSMERYHRLLALGAGPTLQELAIIERFRARRARHHRRPRPGRSTRAGRAA